MPYNPKSKENLKPRPTFYEVAKQRHEVRLTPEGWRGLQVLAESLGFSVSEFLEQIGRGKVSLSELADILER